MSAGADAEALRAELKRDPLNTAEVLWALSREQPRLVVVESVSPLQGLVVLAPRRPQMPQTAFLWGREPSCCERLLGRLDPAAAYWLSAADPEAASAARLWASEVTWEGEETNYTVAQDGFRPHPHSEVRLLTEADSTALEESPRAHVARALSVRSPGQGSGNRLFGVVRDGAWCGDGFCMHVYGDIWVVADVAVAEGCRQQGLGKGLVTACTEYVFAQGGTPTYQADTRNEPSRRLCEALGYAPVGRRFRFELRAP
ncbi:MAG: GNAT family N-acetyltransferase [Bacillota bacterium]|nr:GNAT family N-acetyltransferase [Bacillota bacterium]